MTDSPLSTLYSDVRLERKREEIGNGFTGSQNCSIHSTFTDYNEQKGVYRFFSNPKVTETILIKELQRKCSSAVEGKRVLAILDTSTITLDTNLGRITDFEGLGLIGKNQHSSSFGLFLHPIYVIDEADSTPYGLADVHLHNRSMEQNPLNVKEKRSLKAKMPIERKESFRWVGPSIKARDTVFSKAENLTFVMDREADIWEVYERIPNRKTDVVVRSSQNRRIINSLGTPTKLYTELEDQKSSGTYEIELPRKQGRKREKAIVDIKMGSCDIIPSQFNSTDMPIRLSYVEIKEIECEGVRIEDPLHWIIWTSREVTTIDEAKEIIEIYAKRWGIEVFFKLLKSDGYNIEKTQLESGRAIRKLILIIMDAATRVLQLKAARQGETELQLKDVFKKEEIECLELLNKKLSGRTQLQQNPYPKTHLAWGSWVVARLAGWKDFYSNKNPPGNKTFMKGLEKFDSVMVAYSLFK